MQQDHEFVDLINSTETQTSTSLTHYAVSAYSHHAKFDKLAPLLKEFMTTGGKAVIFTETKRQADQIVRSNLPYPVCALHSDVPQIKRDRLL